MHLLCIVTLPLLSRGLLRFLSLSLSLALGLSLVFLLLLRVCGVSRCRARLATPVAAAATLSVRFGYCSSLDQLSTSATTKSTWSDARERVVSSHS